MIQKFNALLMLFLIIVGCKVKPSTKALGHFLLVKKKS